jgi:hypothetical protein
MSAMPNPEQSEFSKDSLPVKLVEVVTIDPADLKNDQSPGGRPSVHRRSPLALTRFLITFCIGVAAAVAWQSYGDGAKEIIASSYPQLGWLALHPAPTAQNTSDVSPLVAPTASSPDRQLNAMSLDAVRQSVDPIATSIDANQEQIMRSIDRMAASQEQIARSLNQLTAGQEQMAREMTKLQEIEQYILYKFSEPPPQAAPIATRNSVPRPSQARTVR